MTRMNYDRNHARSLSSGRRYYGDEAVYVDCMICGGRQPADGVHAIRAQAERGVKSRMRYRGPAQVWLCRECVQAYGHVVTRDLADELVQDLHGPQSLPEPDPAAEDPQGSSFWKWALAAGAVALIGGGIWLW